MNMLDGNIINPFYVSLDINSLDEITRSDIYNYYDKVYIMYSSKKNNKNLPGKWIKLNIENSTSFYNNLLDYVRKTCGNIFSKNNYNITYKVNGQEQLIVLDDDDDFITFIEKYKDLSSSKHMVIYININNLP